MQRSRLSWQKRRPRWTKCWLVILRFSLIEEPKSKSKSTSFCSHRFLLSNFRSHNLIFFRGQIDSLKADLNDTNNVLASLHSKAAALQTQKEACMKVIDYAVEYFSGSNVSSKEKVFKLKGLSSGVSLKRRTSADGC